MRWLVVVPDKGSAVLHLLTNNTSWMKKSQELQYIYLFFPPSLSFFFHLSYSTPHGHPELSWHHVTSTKLRLSFQKKPGNLPNFVCSILASFRYIQLYMNVNASDVDSFSTHSDGGKGPRQRKPEGNCQGENADTGYKSTLGIGLGPCNGVQL